MSYTTDFYEGQAGGSLQAARVVVPILTRLFEPSSVIDVGCGVGTWMRVFEEAGVQRCAGIEGAWIRSQRTLVDRELITVADLNAPLHVKERYDLAITLEVAEHLRPESSERFVGLLTSLSDTVVFSAAIPGQGGTDHVNERWPDFWRNHFSARGYQCTDLLRPLLWHKDMPYWYAQNAFVYHRGPLSAEVRRKWEQLLGGEPAFPLRAVHPEKVKRIGTGEDLSVRQLAKLMPPLLLRSLKRRLHLP